MLDARPGLGWRTGATRHAMKEQIDLLQSFEPADRVRAGQELVAADLGRSADPLLDHVANEFDDRVLTAIARAVVATPAERKESRRVQELRAWAESELERLALEEAFLGREPEPVEFTVEAPVGADPVPAPRPELAPRPRPVVAPVVAEPAPAAPPVPAPAAPPVPAPAVPPVPTPAAPPEPARYISWRPPGDHDAETKHEITSEAANPALVWTVS